VADFDPKAFDSKPAWQLAFEGAWPSAVAFVGPHRLAAGDNEGRLILWELPDDADAKTQPKPIRRLDGHTNGVTRLVALPDGRTLVSAGLDHAVRIWDVEAPPTGQAEIVLDAETREKARQRSGKKDAAEAPGVSVETITAAHTLDGHKDWVQALGMSRDGRRLISGDDDGLTIVWDVENRKEIARWSGYPGNWVSSAALSPDGNAAFTAEYCFKRDDFDRPPAQARFWNVSDGTERVDLLKIQFPNVKVRDSSYGYASTWSKFVGQGFFCADFSPDGKLLAVGQGGEIGTAVAHLIDVETGKLVRSVASHQYGVCDVQFTPDGKHLLSVGRDTTLQITTVADGKQAAKFSQPRGGQFKDWLAAVALSPDGRTLAAADISGLVQVWRA
jgi:WD40 repeat protein